MKSYKFAYAVSVLFLLSCSCWEFFLSEDMDEMPRSQSQIIPFNPSGCQLPCILNINPGETTIAEAIEEIEATVPIEHTGLSTVFWINIPQSNPILVQLHQGDPRFGSLVNQVDVTAPDGDAIVTLGDLLSIQDTPDAVYRKRFVTPSGVHLLILLSNMDIVAEVTGHYIDENTPVTGIYVLNSRLSQELITQIRNSRKYDDEIRWIGYSASDDYLHQDAIVR